MPEMNSKNVPTVPKTQLPDAAGRIAELIGGMTNIQNSILEAGGVASAFPFIGINNAGVWAYGQDRIEADASSLWAIDIRTWMHGYIAWPDQKAKERKPLGERMVPASAPLPAVTSLPNVGQPYQLQFSFELKCIAGADDGVMALYKNGSYGAKVLVQDLVEKVKAQAKADPAHLCPVVVLDIRSYFHSEWKKDIYNPVLKIQKWISFEDYDDASGEAEAEAEAAPARRAPARAAPEVAARGNGRRTPEPKPKPVPVATRRPGRRAQPSA
jgi:hypothetical protein